MVAGYMVSKLHHVIVSYYTESPSPPSNSKMIKLHEFATLMYMHVLTETRCPIEGQEYTECGTACPLTCKAPDLLPCTRQCVPGCQCPRGTILDEDSKRCVEHCLIPPCQRGKLNI